MIDRYQSCCADRENVRIARLSFNKSLCDSLIIPFPGPILASSDPFQLADSFKALARLAEDKHIKQITYCNFLEEKDTCVQWQAIYEDEGGERWQIDMVHIIKGSYYDGYFERMADGIKSVLTVETRQAILKLKQDTPENEHIMGMEYYQAVIRDGVRTMDEFVQWRKAHPVEGIIEWIPQS